MNDPFLSHPETLLHESPYSRLLVEIDFVEGYRPSYLAIDALKMTLQDVTRKGSIQFVPLSIIPAQDSPYSDEELTRIHLETFNSGDPVLPTGSKGNATLHIVYLNGVLADDSALAQYGPMETIFIFLDDLDGDLGYVKLPGSGLNFFRDKYERATLIHELGHAFGLVNCGIPMKVAREDSSSRCHSVSSSTVMYAGLHNPGPFPLDPIPDPVWRFDEDDLKDIRAYQDS